MDGAKEDDSDEDGAAKKKQHLFFEEEEPDDDTVKTELSRPMQSEMKFMFCLQLCSPTPCRAIIFLRSRDQAKKTFSRLLLG
jgi:hypothetical protein